MAEKLDYTIGISTGMWGIAHDPSIGLGFGSKIQQITTYGVKFVMVNMEMQTSTEFLDPELPSRLKIAIDNLGIDWGIHGEIGEHVAFENALEVNWKQSQRRLHQYLDYMHEIFIKNPRMGKKYLPKFINMHVSNSTSITFIVERYKVQRQITVDFKGRFDWTRLLEENSELKKWFKENLLGGIEISRVGLPSLGVEAQQYFMHPIISEFIDRISNRRGRGKMFSLESGRLEDVTPEQRRALASQEAQVQQQTKAAKERLEELKKMNPDDWIRLTDKMPHEDKEFLIEYLYHYWMAFGAAEYGRGTIQNEDLAYIIIAKYLEFKRNDPKEPIWKLFFGDKTLEALEKDWGRKMIDPNTKYIWLHPDIVAAVGIRYIIGHFETEIGGEIIPEYISEVAKRLNEPQSELDSLYKKCAFEKLEKLGVVFCWENPELMEVGREGLQRIIRARHMYDFLQAVYKVRPSAKDYMKLVIDWNHYISNGIEPIKELQSVPDDFGSFVYVTHIYYPYPVHTHEPFDIGSDAQRILYEYHYAIMKKGFKKGVLVFERGGGKSPLEIMRSSVEALRMIVEELGKNTLPKDLPLTFYGVSPEGFYSEERQMAIIIDHSRDPLKGLIMVPEETYRFLGKSAIDKGKKPEEWAKEEWR